MKFVVVLLLSVTWRASLGSAAVGQPAPPDNVATRNAGDQAKPYLGSYEVEDSCMFNVCDATHISEFSQGKPVAGSCSGECDSLAHRLVNSKFKREFLWGKCVQMCAEKYPKKEYKSYNTRLNCVGECFQAFEQVSPHRHVAQACIHSACSDPVKVMSGFSTYECFEHCTHHVATSVPKEDWAKWAGLLTSVNCDADDNDGIRGGKAAPHTPRGLHTDHLTCTDRALWDELTASSDLSKDIHLLCLNAMCDNSVRCGKDCLDHVTNVVPSLDLTKWRQCTFSAACSKVSTYEMHKGCADECLESHKAALQRQERERQRMAEERRKKEAEALLGASAGSNVHSAAALVMASLIAALLL